MVRKNDFKKVINVWNNSKPMGGTEMKNEWINSKQKKFKKTWTWLSSEKSSHSWQNWQFCFWIKNEKCRMTKNVEI